MLDEKKVRLMARTALYEQSLGSGTIKLNRQFEKGAGKAAFFYHVPAGVITFFLAALLAVAFGRNWAEALFANLGMGRFLLLAFAALVVFVACYCFYARYMSRKKFEAQKGVFWKYRFMAEKLRGTTKKKLPPIEKDAGGAGK